MNVLTAKIRVAETTTNSDVTRTKVEPLKVFEHSGFEEQLAATIETGVRVIIEKQRLLGDFKRFTAFHLQKCYIESIA